MEPVKRKDFKIGDYIYDSKRNFNWFKIIDNHFYGILKKFKKILFYFTSL